MRAEREAEAKATAKTNTGVLPLRLAQGQNDKRKGQVQGKSRFPAGMTNQNDKPKGRRQQQIPCGNDKQKLVGHAVEVAVTSGGDEDREKDEGIVGAVDEGGCGD